jgi:hypothetical protein
MLGYGTSLKLVGRKLVLLNRLSMENALFLNIFIGSNGYTLADFAAA